MRDLIRYAEKGVDATLPVSQWSSSIALPSQQELDCVLQFFLSNEHLACYPLFSKCYRLAALRAQNENSSPSQALSLIRSAYDYDHKHPANDCIQGDCLIQIGQVEEALSVLDHGLKLCENGEVYKEEEVFL